MPADYHPPRLYPHWVSTTEGKDFGLPPDDSIKAGGVLESAVDTATFLLKQFCPAFQKLVYAAWIRDEEQTPYLIFLYTQPNVLIDGNFVTVTAYSVYDGPVE